MRIWIKAVLMEKDNREKSFLVRIFKITLESQLRNEKKAVGWKRAEKDTRILSLNDWEPGGKLTERTSIGKD